MSANAQEILSTADMQTIVRDRVRAAVGLAIPDEKWDALINREITAFFESENQDWTVVEIKDNSSSYHPRTIGTAMQTKMTPFRALVWKQLADMFNERIKEFLEGPDFKVKLDSLVTENKDGLTTQFTERQEAMLQRMAPVLVQELFRGIIGSGYNQVANALFSGAIVPQYSTNAIQADRLKS